MIYVQAQGEEGSESAPVDAAGAFRMDKAPVGHVQVTAMALSFDGSARASRVNELDLAPGVESETVLEFSEGALVFGDGDP